MSTAPSKRIHLTTMKKALSELYPTRKSIALHGKKIGFEKVIKMVDDMAALLKQEQSDDDNQKEYLFYWFLLKVFMC